MRFRTTLCLATLFLVCFTVAVWSEPLPSQPAVLGSTVENQSIAGKISSVGDASFAVDVQKNQDMQTLQFLVDGNTKVEGKLAVGAQATVEYRADAGKNVAVHVVVTPASGMEKY